MPETRSTKSERALPGSFLIRTFLAFAVSALFCTSAAFAQQAPASTPQYPQDEVAQASNPFADVPANHWAYDAVRQLAADGYIQGYPDGQFKGQRPMTRYEAAVLTDRAVRSIEAKLAQLQQVEQRDIAAVRALINAFRPELDQIKSQIAALQRKTADQDKALADLKKEADATQLRVNQGKLGFQMVYKPGTAFNNVSVVNGGATPVFGTATGQAIPGGLISAANNNVTSAIGGTQAFTFGGAGATNSSTLGPFQHGVSSTLMRFFLGGQVDPRWSYGLRISDRVIQSNGVSGLTTVAPSFCNTLTTTNCSFSDLNNGQGTLALNLDYAYLQYSSPGGITAKIGRWGNGSYGKYSVGGTTMFFGGGQTTGLELGFNDPAGRVFGEMYLAPSSVSAFTLSQSQGVTTAGATVPTAQAVCSTNVVGLNLGPVQPQFSQVNPNCNTSQGQLAAWAGYYFPYSRTFVGSTYVLNSGGQYTYYDAAAVNCTYAGVARMAMSPALCAANGGVQVPGQATGNFLTAEGNNSGVEAYLSQYFGPFDRPQWNASFTWARHLGGDPINGGAFGGANAYYAQLTYASKGNVYNTCCRNPFFSGTGYKGSNVGQLFFAYYGLGSNTGSTTYNGTTPLYNNTGLANLSGMQVFGFEAAHWLSDNVRVAVGGYHVQNIPGVTIPVGVTGASNTCPGCFVNSLNQNQLLLDTYLYFF